MDRERARSTIGAGLGVSVVALFVFGMAFYVTILYLQ